MKRTMLTEEDCAKSMTGLQYCCDKKIKGLRRSNILSTHIHTKVCVLKSRRTEVKPNYAFSHHSLPFQLSYSEGILTTSLTRSLKKAH